MSDLFSGSLAAQEGPSVSSPAKSRLAKPAPGNRTGRARLKAQGDADRASAKEIGNPLKNNNQFSASSNPGQRPPLLCHSYHTPPRPECRPMSTADTHGLRVTTPASQACDTRQLDLFPSDAPQAARADEVIDSADMRGTDTAAIAPPVAGPDMPASPARKSRRADPMLIGDARPQTLWACLQFLATQPDLPRTLLREARSAVSTVQRMMDHPTGSKRRWKPASEPVGQALPANPMLLRPILSNLQPRPHGLTHRRMRKINSAIGCMLQRSGWIGRALWPVTPQAPAFAALWQQARKELIQQAGPLGPAFRYWDEQGLEPGDVRSTHLLDYVNYRNENSVGRTDPRLVGLSLVSAWNRMIELSPQWPQVRLQLPSQRPPRKSPRMGDLLPAVQEELGHYLRRLEEPDDREDDVSEPMSPDTVRQRRDWILRAIGCLQVGGMPLEQFTHLSLLTEPDNFWAVLVTLRKEFNNVWSQTAKQVAYSVVSLAKRWVRPPPATLTELDRLARKVRLRRRGLSSRNIDILEQFDTDEKRQALLDLPIKAYEQVRDEIRRDGRVSVNAARTYEIALALEILFTQPIRIKNLSDLSERHFKRDANGILKRIHISHQEAKTRNLDINILISSDLAERIEWHWKTFRPFLLYGQPSNSGHLFPGPNGNTRRRSTLAKSIKRFVTRQLSAHFTPHVARHLAVAILLEKDPNNLVVASRLLGHANPKITQQIYGVLLTSAAQGIWLASADALRQKAAQKEQRQKKKAP